LNVRSTTLRLTVAILDPSPLAIAPAADRAAGQSDTTSAPGSPARRLNAELHGTGLLTYSRRRDRAMSRGRRQAVDRTGDGEGFGHRVVDRHGLPFAPGGRERRLAQSLPHGRDPAIEARLIDRFARIPGQVA
jgi:hypothetical protein